ncbi:hypothetical protein H7J77_10825 [Mycolicibacillus parakoreensis]|uniref:FUSC family protein n=1 Tax=Mycolicibacillus parakoreensis TaxID=1069221 RepID=A0ABY3U2Z1_9MYCO|nr:hypothetical protein [Mycolicibacillus parakoreensis]MCV7316033.1 hypothetical protein [Mycolicibacillus parakoreensis]ULN52345.1 hypothetical protein MIU77_16090 [Mycolicibacillus parakoreensis]
MSDTPEDQPTRPISVAELLARHGNIGSPPVTGRKRRRRGNADAVSVAELTGEIPVIRDPDDPEAPDDAETAEDAVEDAVEEGAEETPADEAAPAARPAAASDQREDPVRFSEPQPRWPQSAPHAPGKTGPQRSPHPLPDRKADRGGDRSEGGSDAEQMSPDPVDVFPAVSMADLGLGADPDEDLLDTVDDGPTDAEAPARPARRGLLGALRSRFARPARGADEQGDDAAAAPTDDGQGDPAAAAGTASLLDATAEPTAGRARSAEWGFADRDTDGDSDGDSDWDTDWDADTDSAEHDGDAEEGPWHDERDEQAPESLLARVARGVWGVAQSLLAVVFGAGLFIAFDQLWRWNSVVALVLTVLVTLGLVAAVQAVRKTVDITSTLIAVAVGLLVTLGPLVLWLSG